MKVGIIGAGYIGGGIARQLAGAGHELMLAFSRNPETLEALAASIGPSAAPRKPRGSHRHEAVTTF
jgi:predicted dinucleotide-binding enzyme